MYFGLLLIAKYWCWIWFWCLCY